MEQVRSHMSETLRAAMAVYAQPGVEQLGRYQRSRVRLLQPGAAIDPVVFN